MKKTLLSGMIGLLSAQPVLAIDLVEVYERALSYDSGIATARASLNAQLAGSDVSRSNLLPRINAFGEAGHTDRSAGALSDSFKSYSYGVQLTQPLFRADAWFGFEASKEQSEKARAEYSLAQQQLILNVATAYFNVLRAGDALTTTRAAETAFKRQYEQAQERYDVGLIAITEVFEARATFDATTTQRIAAENELDIAREQLARLTGEYHERVHNLQQNFPLARPEPLDVSAWEQTALEQNWQIQAANAELRVNESRFKVARSGHYPTLDLSARYAWQDTDGFANQMGPGNNDRRIEDTTLALSLNVPLYAGGGTQAGVRQQRSLVDVAMESLETTRRDVRVNTRSLFRSVNTNIEAVSALEQTIISRRSALDATRAGYEVGTRNIVEVLEAERNYYVALRDYADARYDYVINTLRLKQAAGTLSPQDLMDLNQWISATAPGIEALASEDDNIGAAVR